MGSKRRERLDAPFFLEWIHTHWDSVLFGVTIVRINFIGGNIQGWLLLAMAIATSAVAQENELEEPMTWSFPDAVHPIEALDATIESENRWCANHTCRRRLLGNFLFLDLAGPPAWRQVDSFYYFSDSPRNEASTSVYLDLEGRGGQKQEHFWYPVVGMLFSADQLPGVAPGEIAEHKIAGDETPFLYNGRTYRLRFEPRCHQGSWFNGPAFFADMSIFLLADGIEQQLSTTLKTNGVGMGYSSCDEAKANLPKAIHFDFVGDMDGDGKLDLVFMNNAGGFFPTVYMSRYAEPSQLLKAFSSNESC